MWCIINTNNKFLGRIIDDINIEINIGNKIKLIKYHIK